MKITRNTPEQLVLDHVPWLLSIGLVFLILLFVGIGLLPLGQTSEPMWWLFSGMFIFVGGGLWFLCLAVFAKRLQFIFDRSEDRITMRRRSILKHQETRHRLSRLKEAILEQDYSENGQVMLRPVLILSATRAGGPSEQRVPLHHYFTNGPGPEAMVEVINTWLARDPASQTRQV